MGSPSPSRGKDHKKHKKHKDKVGFSGCWCTLLGFGTLGLGNGLVQT